MQEIVERYENELRTLEDKVNDASKEVLQTSHHSIDSLKKADVDELQEQYEIVSAIHDYLEQQDRNNLSQMVEDQDELEQLRHDIQYNEEQFERIEGTYNELKPDPPIQRMADNLHNDAKDVYDSLYPEEKIGLAILGTAAGIATWNYIRGDD